ncbi:MAG: NrfD/PsrC family molybdoenzyme membrane anchor subunit, partial [Dermatophilaceae bacterium]
MTTTRPTSDPTTTLVIGRMTTARLRVLWYAALSVLLAVGLVALVIWLLRGNAVTNLTSTVPWGAWVAFYLFFLGLSAGSFLLSTLVYVFGMHRFERIGRSALLSAIISMGVGLAFIGVDLGRVERAGFVMRYFHWSSPLSWEVRFYLVYMTLLITELVIAIRLHRGLVKSSERANRWLRILGTIGIPLAIFGVHGGTGTIFAVVKARGMWSGGLFPVIFVVSAMVSGTALLAVIYYLQRRSIGRRPDADLLNGLGTVLTTVLLIDMGLMFYEFIVPLLAFQEHDTDVIWVITF